MQIYIARIYISHDTKKSGEKVGWQVEKVGRVCVSRVGAVSDTWRRRYDTKEGRMFDNLHNALVQFMTDYIWVRHQASSTNPSQFDSNQHAIKSRGEETRLYFVM